MNKIYRKGADIKVAFLLAAKKITHLSTSKIELPVSKPSVSLQKRSIARRIAIKLRNLINDILLQHKMLGQLHQSSITTNQELQLLKSALETLKNESQSVPIEVEKKIDSCDRQEEVIVIGAGGHAKVCIELLRAMGKKVAFCISLESDLIGVCLDVPVLRGNKNLTFLYENGYRKIFIAVGSNTLRAHLRDFALVQGYELLNAISPTAIISPTAQLGVGIAIMAGVVINAQTIIEDLAIINTGAVIDHDCYIAHAAHIAPQCGLAGNVRVGSYSFLGIGCKVIPDIEIGEKAIVGAGSVVISSIASEAKVMGIPAKTINA